jgi:hypothetical protein
MGSAAKAEPASALLAANVSMNVLMVTVSLPWFRGLVRRLQNGPSGLPPDGLAGM